MRRWKGNEGFKATYELLLEKCLNGDDTKTAENICVFLRDNIPEGE